MIDKNRIIIKNKITGDYHDTCIPTIFSCFLHNGELYARIRTVDIDGNETKLDILAERLIEWVDEGLKPAYLKLMKEKRAVQ